MKNKSQNLEPFFLRFLTKKVLLIKSIQSIRHPPYTDVKMDNVPIHGHIFI